MWLENLRALKTIRKVSTKQIAEQTDLAERTVTRIFSGETENPGMDYVIKIVRALDGSLDDIFENTKAVVGSSDLVSLQNDNNRLNEELADISAENTILKEKIGVLTAEINVLRINLEHKEEIISIHNYYINKHKTE